MTNLNQTVNIQFETNANTVNNDVSNLGQSIDNLSNANQRTAGTTSRLTSALSSNVHAVQANGGAMGLLNDLTGGLAMTFKDAYEASDLFRGGMNRMLTAVRGFSAGARAALAATGIGLLLVAAGTLISYWDDIKGLVGGVNSEMKKQGELASKNVSLEESKLETLNNQDNILKLQGKSERDIALIKKKQTDETIKALEAQLASQEAQKKAQVEAAKRNRDILSGILKFISAPITVLLKSVDAVGKALGKDFNLEEKVFGSITKLVFDPEEVATEGDKVIAETKKKLNELKNTSAGYTLQVQSIDKEAADKRREAQKKRAEEEAKALQDQKDKLADIEKKYALDIANLNAKTEQEKLDEQKRQAQAELDALKLSKDKKVKAQQLLDEKFRLLQNDLDEKIKADNLTKLTELLESRKLKEEEFTSLKNAADIEALRIKNENELLVQQEADLLKAKNLGASEAQLAQIKAYYSERKTENDKQAAEADKKIDELTVEGKKNAVNAIGETLKTASNLLGKNTAASKALAIAGTTIDTLQSSISAYKGMVAAIPGPGGLIAGAIAAASSIATGFATVKKITAVQVPGSTGGSGGGSALNTSSIPASAAANVSFVASSENQIAGSIARQTNEQPPIKAYVVSTEVSTAQSLDRNLINSVSV